MICAFKAHNQEVDAQAIDDDNVPTYGANDIYSQLSLDEYEADIRWDFDQIIANISAAKQSLKNIQKCNAMKLKGKIV